MICAYCNAQKVLTREHIWPHGLRKFSNYGISYSEAANKVFSGDLVIKDVCAECNNGPLSRLDNYGVSLYESILSRLYHPRKDITFDYDYSMLSRWLLKISYNSSRGTDIDSKILSRYAPILIAPGDCCPTNLAIYVGRIAPTRKKNGALLLPKWHRSGRLAVKDRSALEQFALRSIVIDGFSFSIAVSRDPLASLGAKASLAKFLYGVPLDPSGKVNIPAPEIDTLGAAQGILLWPRTSQNSKDRNR